MVQGRFRPLTLMRWGQRQRLLGVCGWGSIACTDAIVDLRLPLYCSPVWVSSSELQKIRP